MKTHPFPHPFAIKKAKPTLVYGQSVGEIEKKSDTIPLLRFKGGTCMRRRVLSMFICIVVLIGLLPTTVHAGTHNETVTSVTIKELDYPIAGKELDTSYSVPTSGVYYTKSTSNSVVTWYDQGTSGIGTTSSGEELEANAKAENGHYYMAKIELMDVVYAGKSETGAYC